MLDILKLKLLEQIKIEIMPNHVYQKLRIDNWSDKGSIKKIKEKILNDKGEFDFNKIIPQPENIFNGNLGKKERQMCKNEGRPNWYDWNTENWGTKWGAYSFELNEYDSTTLSFNFQTAWNVSEPVMDKVFELCKGCDIQYLAVDEGGFFAFSITVDEDGNVTRKDLKDSCEDLLFAMRE